jgi:hypothetical protein
MSVCLQRCLDNMLFAGVFLNPNGILVSITYMI